MSKALKKLSNRAPEPLRVSSAAAANVKYLMPSELREFFESYRDSWNEFSGEAIASHYRIPTKIIDMDGLHTYVQSEDLAEKFQSNCQMYQKLGYAGASFIVGSYISNGDSAATIDIGWRVMLGGEYLDFRTTYMCALISGQWLIVSSVAYDSPYNEDDT
jgi:hypothetical protein